MGAQVKVPLLFVHSSLSSLGLALHHVHPGSLGLMRKNLSESLVSHTPYNSESKYQVAPVCVYFYFERTRVDLRSAGLRPLAAEIMDRVGLLCTERR